MSKQRIKWIDACKGLGILTVVIGHVTHGYIAAGMYSESLDLLKAIDYIIYSFHMFMFFMISGFTYNMAYGESDNNGCHKLIKQLKNLFYVFSLFSIAQWCFKFVFSKFVNSEYTVIDLLLFAIKPMSPYWYLWVLIIYYCLFYILKGRKNQNQLLIGMSLIVSCLASFIKTGFDETPKNVLFFIAAFCIGTFLLQYEVYLKSMWVRVLSFVGTICLWGVIAFCRIELQSIPIIGVLGGLIISVLVISIVKNWNMLSESKILGFLGKYSLEIYVMHCFITAPLRKVFSVFNLSMIVNVGLSVIISIGLSLLAVVILKKCNLYRVFFKPFA